jgi:hypothetical protein
MSDGGGRDVAASEVRLTRKERYDLVWLKPLSKLAEEFDVSDVGLAKMCTRMSIPRPPQGHWLRLKLGKGRGVRPPLPRATASMPQEVVLSQASGDRPKASPRKPPSVIVPGTLENPHPLVARIGRGLQRGTPCDVTHQAGQFSLT